MHGTFEKKIHPPHNCFLKHASDGTDLQVKVWCYFNYGPTPLWQFQGCLIWPLQE
jgi:hypothetical protein